MTDYENTALPDLTADHIITRDSSGALSRTFQLGGNFRFYWEEHNIGTASLDPNINPYQIGIYLSTDQVINSDDISLGVINVPAPGISSSVLTSGAGTAWGILLSLGLDLAPGECFLGVIEDFGNSVAELNETNNSSSAVPITVTGSAGAISIDDVSITEGNSGARVMTFTVTRTGGTAAFAVNYATSDGGATLADGDYVATSGTLSFATGENTKTISVTVRGDTKIEGDQTFSVSLSGPTNGATIIDNLGIGTITNDDHPLSDFNGDGRSDILLQYNGGAIVDWTMNGSEIIGAQLITYHGNPITALDPSWKIAATGDFNGDGSSDILLRNSGGTVVDWTMSGSQIAAAEVLAYQTTPITNLDPSWRVEGTGDFNGDGNSDILLRDTIGTIVAWTMNGSQINDAQVLTYHANAITALDSSWKVVGTGDFNGDGSSDILLRNGGTVVDWTMNGSQISAAQVLTYQTVPITGLDSSWDVEGIGDFDGDGNSDILLRSTDGSMVVWTMSGSQITAAQLVTYQATPIDLDSSWKTVRFGDFDGNGTSDILLRDTGGTVVDWAMNGSEIAAAQVLTYGASAVTNLDSAWNIVHVPAVAF